MRLLLLSKKNQKQPSLIQKLKTPREQFALSELQKEVQNGTLTP